MSCLKRRVGLFALASAALGTASIGMADVAITNFTPGDLVVLRGGDSAVANSASGGSAPVNGFSGTVNAYLDEFTPAGTYVGTIPVPGLNLNGAGVSSHEGELNLSTNGQWLTMSGYDPAQFPAGTTTHAIDGTENVIVGKISQYAPSLDTSTKLIGTGGTTSVNGQFTHGATSVDGQEFFLSGKNVTSANGAIWNATTPGSGPDLAGLQYINGVGGSATVTTLQGGTDWRNVTIFNNTLYGATGSSSVGTHGGYLIGSAGTLPTTTGNATPGHALLTAGSNSSSNLAVLNVATADPGAGTQNGANVMYSIFDGSIQKNHFTGTNWAGSTSTVDGVLLQNAVGLVAQIDPTNASWVDLWISDPSGLYAYVDKSGDPLTAIPANSFTRVAAPDANGSFYGVAVAPVPEPASISALAVAALALGARRRRN